MLVFYDISAYHLIKQKLYVLKISTIGHSSSIFIIDKHVIILIFLFCSLYEYMKKFSLPTSQIWSIPTRKPVTTAFLRWFTKQIPGRPVRLLIKLSNIEDWFWMSFRVSINILCLEILLFDCVQPTLNNTSKHWNYFVNYYKK